jgi:formate dehydrogenase iron-sulfur subunit
MSVTIYVSGDAAALALGADEVAAAIVKHAAKHKQDISIVRNGSRGLFWLEPLVEVVTAQGRVAYGPVTVADVPKLFAANFTAGGKHKLHLGDIEAHPYLAKQQRVSLRRVGVINPRLLDDYLSHAVAAARPSPPASSGRLYSIQRPRRNTSCATLTKEIRVRSPTAC